MATAPSPPTTNNTPAPPSGPSSPVLTEIAEKRNQVLKRLAQFEKQLYESEEQYLDLTSARGNTLRGFDAYLEYKIPRHGGMGRKDTNNRRLKPSERIHSFSSTTAPIPKEELARDEDATAVLKWAEEYRVLCEQTSGGGGTTAQPPASNPPKPDVVRVTPTTTTTSPTPPPSTTINRPTSSVPAGAGAAATPNPTTTTTAPTTSRTTTTQEKKRRKT